MDYQWMSKKNTYMMFTNRPVTDVKLPIILNDCTLNPVEVVICLGVATHSNLNFNVCSKVAKLIGVMCKMKEYLPGHCYQTFSSS